MLIAFWIFLIGFRIDAGHDLFKNICIKKTEYLQYDFLCLTDLLLLFYYFYFVLILLENKLEFQHWNCAQRPFCMAKFSLFPYEHQTTGITVRHKSQTNPNHTSLTKIKACWKCVWVTYAMCFLLSGETIETCVAYALTLFTYKTVYTFVILLWQVVFFFWLFSFSFFWFVSYNTSIGNLWLGGVCVVQHRLIEVKIKTTSTDGSHRGSKLSMLSIFRNIFCFALIIYSIFTPKTFNN